MSWPAAVHRRRGLLLAALAVAAGLGTPAGAGAAVTIGAPLDQPANVTVGCEIAPSLFGFGGPGAVLTGATSCTWLGADRIANPTWTMQTPRGQWVIVRVRVRAGGRVGPMAAVVLGNLRSQVGAGGGTICCRAMAESPVFTPLPNRITEIPTRMPVGNTVSVVTGEPVETVDYLAIHVLSLAASLPLRDTGQYQDLTAVRSSAWWPAMRLNQEQPLTSGYFGMFPLVQADLEPDADGDGFGDETQDSCPTNAAVRSRPVATAAQCPAPPAAAAPPPAGLVPGPFLAGPGPTRDSAQIGSARTTAIPVLCPPEAPASCTGTVGARTVKRLATRAARTAATARLRLTPRPFSVAPGQIGHVRLTLPAGARRELARRARLALDVTVAQTAPSASTTTHRITVRRIPTRARATRAGKVTLRFADLANADPGRGASYTLRAAPEFDVVARRFTAPRPGRVRGLSFTLDAATRAALRRAGRLKVRLEASYTSAAGFGGGAGQTYTLLRPR